MQCRSCQFDAGSPLIDLGHSPIANAFLTEAQLKKMEPTYPLGVYVCPKCFLVQLPEFESPQQIFSDYAYFSSFSDSWLRHAKHFVLEVSKRFGLGADSQVIEIASNDGYLLQYFKELKIPILGVEPAANVARVALQRGIPTEIAFFGQIFAKQLKADQKAADLIVANNVLAHVPDLNDFVGGMEILLKAQGVLSIEFPHLINLLKESQFDTIYHEHFSYLSIHAIQVAFERHGLRIFDIQKLSTHGGSLRVLACRKNAIHTQTPAVAAVLDEEKEAGVCNLQTYVSFNQKVIEVKRQLLTFLLDAQKQKKKVVGYGAPAKGNTLLNFCGVRPDLVAFTVDRNPRKQNHFLPGSHIPVFSPEKLKTERPDFILILPWNLKDEIIEQNSFVREWGCKFVTPIPQLTVSP